MRRPFAVRSLPSAPNAVLHAQIEFVVPLTAEIGARAVKVGQQFYDLANAGALCGDVLSPSESGIGGCRLTVDDVHVDWLFNEVAVDPKSISILLNLVHSMHENYAHVRSVDIGWNQLIAIDTKSEIFFPKIWVPLPFTFSYDPEATSFDIVMDFASPQDNELLGRVNETLGCWLRAVFSGAYGDENSPPHINRVRFDTAEPCTLSAGSLVWAIDRFQSTTHALAGMVNVASRIHQTMAPIVKLEIG